MITRTEIPYKALSGNAGVEAYSLGKDSIQVRFKDNSVYIYDYVSAGKINVEEMKRLAKSGKGLTTFINQHVKDRYATKSS